MNKIPEVITTLKLYAKDEIVALEIARREAKGDVI